MNKQELIEQIKGLKNLFGNKAEYIEIDAAIKLIEQLDEPQKTVIPQFVADWYEEHKDDLEFNIWDWIKYTQEEEKIENRQFTEWLGESENKPVETLVKMKQFGYDVEEEKRYEVILCNGQSLKTVYRQGNDRLDFEKVYGDLERFTRKQLEEDGFGWVFDCPGVEIEEVQDDPKI